MVRHVRSVYLKDHVVVAGNDDENTIAGVTNGSGTIAIAKILNFLIDHAGLERVCIESSYGYCSKVTRNQKQFDAASLTNTTFKPSPVSFDRMIALLDADALYRLDPDALFDFEASAVAHEAAHTRQILDELGFQPHRNGWGGVCHRGGRELAFAQRHR